MFLPSKMNLKMNSKIITMEIFLSQYYHVFRFEHCYLRNFGSKCFLSQYFLKNIPLLSKFHPIWYIILFLNKISCQLTVFDIKMNLKVIWKIPVLILENLSTMVFFLHQLLCIVFIFYFFFTVIIGSV